jgi:gliding motility-associated-like protein
MIKKLLFTSILIFAFLQNTFSQALAVSGIATSGRFSSCAVYTPPVVAINFVSGAGSSVNGSGVLVCTNPCDSTTINVIISNILFDQGNDAQWLHGMFFPVNASYRISAINVAPFVQFSGSTGICNAPNPVVGGPGFYYDAYSGTTTCCGTAPPNNGNPADNWGLSTVRCANAFSLNFNLTLCNSLLINGTQFFRMRGTADGGTGCYLPRNNQTNNIDFAISTIVCGPLYNPLPTATPPQKTCIPSLTFTDTLKGACGNSNTIEWYTTATGGLPVGTGSPFVYSGSVCAGGVTLYASCCPGNLSCVNRKAFLIPNSCPPPFTVDNISKSDPTCLTNCGSINSVTVSGAIGPVTYTLSPGNITNSTGSFACLSGSSYTVTATDSVGCQASGGVSFTPPICGGPITFPIFYCLNQPAVPLTATFTAGGSNLMWYTTLTGGSGTTIAPTPLTNVVGPTTYYVTQMVGGVESTPRTPLVVTVVALPAAPTVTSPVLYCKNAPTVPLTAVGTNLLWYAAASGGVGSATAPTPSSANVGSNIYYVSQTVGICESLRSAITVTIKPTATAAISISKCANEVPFTWNGQTLTIGGTYTNTQPAANGCDSTTTLTFTVKPIATAAIIISKCSNQVPFTWNGQSLTTGGTYTNTQPAANGCDSITTLTFIVKPIATAAIVITKCSNQLPFTWNGQTLTIGGTYTNTQTGANGCDSTTTLTFVVKSITTATIAITKCSNQIPFTWNGQILNGTGTFTNTQTGSNGCDSTTTLNFTVKPIKTATIAISKCSNTLPFVWNGQSLTTAGTYTNTQTGSNGCDSTTTLNFTVLPGAAATVNVSVCSNTLPYTWNGQTITTGGTYTNTQPGPGGCDSITTLNFVVKPTTVASITISKCSNQVPFTWNGQTLTIGGTYTNTQTGSNGCDSTTTLNFTVKPTTTATTDITKCSNQVPFTWNGQTLTIGGTYTNTQTGSNGCDSTTTLNFTVKPTTTATIAISKCSNQVPFTWNGQTLTIGGTYTNTQTGSNGCDSTTTLNFTVKPIATATISTSKCSNQVPFTWNGQSLTTSGTYSNTQVAANGCDSITTLNFTVKQVTTALVTTSVCSNTLPYIWNGQTLTISGTFTNTQTGSNGCDSTTTLNFTVKPTTTATIAITKCSNQVPFTWNGQTLNASGTFTNTQTGSNGCDSTTTLNFTVKPTTTATIAISKCSNQVPFTWNGQTLTIGGTYTNTQTGSNGCDSTTTLNFTVKPIATAAVAVSVCSNTLPYTWNGQSLTTSGTYSNTQVAANGCDSITTLNFTVKQVSTKAIAISRCINTLPFTWNGQTLTIGGTYTNTQLGANGCDSITTLTFIVKPITAATISISKCINTLPFTWNGQTLTIGGTYTNTQIGSNGCDSTTTLNFTVKPITAATIAISKCSNQIPFIWNGQSLSTSGTFTNTQIGSNGCDSTTTLNFTVKPVATALIAISKCSNQVPFTWNGQALTTSGTYTNVQVAANGCDSITTLNFTVKQVATLIISISKCSNQVPFTWNGQALTTSGTYTNTQLGANGCDSITTLNFIVKPTTTVTIAITKCSNQVPFTWNGQTLNASGTFTNTQTGSNGCDSTTTLNFTVKQTTTATVSVTVCSNTLPFTWNGQTLNTSGSYSNTQTGSNGCDSTTTLNFTVNATPAAPITINRLHCQNAIVGVLIATGTNIKWYTTATGGTAISAPTPSTLLPSTITYYASQTVLGCESPRVPLVVTIVATPIAPSVISPVTYCPGDPSVPLIVTSGINLKWYTTATGGIGSTTTPTPSTAAAGTFTYYVSQSTTIGGCEGPRAIIIVNVNNNNLTVTINPIDTTICEMQSVTYSPVVVPEANSYEWRAVGVPTRTISSIDTKVTTVSPVDTATYILKSTLGGCATETTVKVNVIWKPKINAGPNKAICLNDSFLIRPVVTRKSSDSINYYWSPIDSLRTPDNLNTWALPKLSTWYTVKYITKPTYGCDFTDSSKIKITVQPRVIAFAGNDTIAVKDAPHKLRGTGGFNYSWISPNGYSITNPFSQNALITLSNDANVYLTVKDAIGCEASDTIFIKVYEGPTYYIPNSFTPNGDGLNDIFRAIPPGIANTTYFRVFNRFGELMFETNQWLKGWNGTFNGKEQPAGTYVWAVSGVDKNNQKIEMKGTVNLIR